MHFSIITLFPPLFDALHHGVIGRAIEQGHASYQCWNPRDYSHRPHGYIDDHPYGGGPGMIMQAPPLQHSIRAATASKTGKTRRVYLSPRGPTLTQKKLHQFRAYDHIVLLCGRYEGVDERVIESDIDEELSIGDYILSGGEMAALVLIDALIRLHPQCLGHPESAQQDSFSAGLLEYPHYTRPKTVENCDVPAILLGGNHQQIAWWRRTQAEKVTQQRRPDLWAAYTEEKKHE